MQTQSLEGILWQMVPLCKNKGATSFSSGGLSVSLSWANVSLDSGGGGFFVPRTNHTTVCISSDFRAYASSYKA